MGILLIALLSSAIALVIFCFSLDKSELNGKNRAEANEGQVSKKNNSLTVVFGSCCLSSCLLTLSAAIYLVITLLV